MSRPIVAAFALGLALTACAGRDTSSAPASSTSTAVAAITTTTALAPTEPAPTPSTTSPIETTTTRDERSGVAPPDWLGTRLLPLREGEDNAIAQPTPVELLDRQLWTTDVLPSPPDDTFVSVMITPPPDDVVARSTWRDECPVPLSELAYAQVSFFGFDGRFHTGEFITGIDHVEGLIAVFAELHAMRFPIEEMAVTTQEAVDAHPTGDSNNTSTFVCRPAVNSGSWSRHAWGGAIDINPFHNPYLKGDLVIPELAMAYLERGDERVGMVTPAIVDLFAQMGWSWGGNWNSAKDWMHFSDTGG